VRRILPVVSILGLLGAGGAVTWSVLARPADVYITHEVANSFNLQTGPAPARAPVALAAGETLRDAVASAPPAASSLMRPIAAPDMAVGAVKQKPPEKPLTVITAKAAAWARKRGIFTVFAAKPAARMLSRGPMAGSRELRSFLADPKKVDAYMNSALVRITLNSPSVAKALLGNPVLIRAFLATPAMRDPQAVRALLGSAMVRKMLDCPAIQEALGDPAVMNRMVADPETIRFIAGHPEVLMAISSAAPALGDAFTAKRR